jgi:hypothetical protein
LQKGAQARIFPRLLEVRIAESLVAWIALL